MTNDEVLQLAMFTAALNAKLYGAEFTPGVYRPTWEDLGPAGQEAYINEARIQFEAVERIIAKRHPTAPEQTFDVELPPLETSPFWGDPQTWKGTDR